MARIFTDAGAMKLISGTQRRTNGFSFSVAFWINRTATPAADRSIITAADTVATPGWGILLTAANLIQGNSPNGTDKVRNSTSTPALNAWTHVVVTHNDTGLNSTDFTFYFNGKAEAGTSVSNGVGTKDSATAVAIEVGASTAFGTTAPPAQLGPIAIWSRALSPAEALALAIGANPFRFREGLLDVFYMQTAHGETGLFAGTYLAQGATNPTSAAVNPPMEPIPTYLSAERQNYRTRRARYHVPVTGFTPLQRRTRHTFGTHVGGRTQVNA